MKNINNFPSKVAVERVRAAYPSGCRVELISMDDPYAKLKPGELGTVRCVDSIGTVFADWDCGSSLGIAHGVDRIKKL